MGRKQTDIAIIGGGIAGLALAALLGEAGLGVTVAEPRPPLPFDKTPQSGRTVALMNSSVNVLKAAGVWERLDELSAPLQTMRIIDDSIARAKALEIEFPAGEIGAAQFGFNIPTGHLRAALFERVKSMRNVTIAEAGFEGYEAGVGGADVRLADGTNIRALLLAGADGRSSAVRAAAGIAATQNPYGQSAITCLIHHSRSHNFTSTEFHRPSGPFALVPLPGNRSSVVWVERTEDAEAIIRLRKPEFEEALHTRTKNILGGITLETPPECWPLISIRAKSLTAPRVALLAEAAHVMSPITAQGLNLSLRDVAALAESVVDAARLGLDIGAGTVLNAYESRRRIDVGTRVFGVDSMNRIVSTQHEMLKGVRRSALRAISAIYPAKTTAMQIGLAPRIDAGRLIRGERL